MRPDRKWLMHSLWGQGVSLFVLWTAIAILMTVQEYAYGLVYDHPLPFWTLVKRSAEEWYTWGILSFGILWMSHRIRLEPGKMRRAIILHTGCAMVVAVVFLAAAAAWLHGERSLKDGSVLVFGVVFRKLLLAYFPMEILCYWFVVLGHQGWEYYLRYREREVQAAGLAAELAEARLEALRMQLNPHFLFNTLHTISALIHEDPKGADRMVAKLSDLLRQTLYQVKTQEVPLRDELAFLKGYLEIERTRFQDRLAVTFDVEPGLEEAAVPWLILQPLVENSIRHAVEPRDDLGRIRIQARRVETGLELAVTDDGPGLAPVETSVRGNGIGLANTKSRLAHLYGENHRFLMATAPGGGLEVRFSIPLRRDAPPSQPRSSDPRPFQPAAPVTVPQG